MILDDHVIVWFNGLVRTAQVLTALLSQGYISCAFVRWSLLLLWAPEELQNCLVVLIELRCLSLCQGFKDLRVFVKCLFLSFALFESFSTVIVTFAIQLASTHSCLILLLSKVYVYDQLWNCFSLHPPFDMRNPHPKWDQSARFGRNSLLLSHYIDSRSFL